MVRNHFQSGKCESWKIVPLVTENWYRHLLQSYWSRSAIVETLFDLQRGHSTLFCQRSPVRCSRHFSSVPNLSIKLTKFTSDLTGLDFFFIWRAPNRRKIRTK